MKTYNIFLKLKSFGCTIENYKSRHLKLFIKNINSLKEYIYADKVLNLSLRYIHIMM